MNRTFVVRAFGSVWLALLAAALIILAQSGLKLPRTIYADEVEYLTVSRNVLEHGVFSDVPFSDKAPAPNGFFAPVAPLLYAGLMKIDPELHETIACQMAHRADPRPHCRIHYSLLTRGVMAALAVLGLWGSWVLARSFGLGPVGSWIVLAVVAASGSHAYFARHFLTELPLLAVFPFFLALLARATDPATRQRRALCIALGLAMGALALIRPSYVYQAYFIILTLPLLRHFRGAAPIGGLGLGAVLWTAIGYAIAVLPWMLRNAVQLGEFALTTGYDTNILAQRMMYNAMSWREWWMAWIYWLPDFGDTLGVALFGLEAVRKLSLLEPTGYHYAGNPPIAEFLRARIGDAPATLGNLLPHLLAEWPKHVAVTLVMAWQGLWAGKYITFVALLLSPLALRVMALRGQLRGFLVVALPVLLMVGFNAFVSVSIPRYNLPLLWISALVGAVVIEAALRYVTERQPGKQL